MASSQSIQELKEMATCSVCLDLLTDARQLECKHTFCLNCLFNVQTTSTKKPCPLCRAETIPARGALRGLEPNGPLNDLSAMLYRKGISNISEYYNAMDCFILTLIMI